MKRIGLIALALLSVLCVAEARPKAAAQPKVTRVNSNENAYSFQNYRENKVAQSAPVSGVMVRPYNEATYNQGYPHLIAPDGFGPPPSAYSMGPGWANRQGFYGSGTIAYPYNAGGFVNTGYINGGFFPGRY